MNIQETLVFSFVANHINQLLPFRSCKKSDPYFFSFFNQCRHDFLTVLHCSDIKVITRGKMTTVLVVMCVK